MPASPASHTTSGPPALCGLAELAALHPLPAQAPLDDKLSRARQILDTLLRSPGLSPAQIAVAFTGGKDSSVALHLWRVALGALGRGPLRAISVDTGLKFPQVTGFRDELAGLWGVELALARHSLDLAAYPVAADKLSCCRDLKIAPLGAALAGTGTKALITGIRRDENPSRAQRPYVEERPATEHVPAHWQANPLLDWTELDIWACITGQGLPYCGLYHQGYRSLSCRPCTSLSAGVAGDGAERAGRAQEKEAQMEQLKSLGYF